ncbi:MAG: chemotaxis protein CheW [Elusimicrobiaceae bacterium]|nr:chemotaxis protein CheW [Elusimicrobiaceae bacterium]
MKASATLNLVVFRIGPHNLCVPISAVQEVLDSGRMVQLPRCPELLSGIVNLRGHVIAVVNLRRNFPDVPQAVAGTHIIIINAAGGANIGLMVDLVRMVAPVAKSDFTQPETAPGGANRAIILASIVIAGEPAYLLDTGRIFSKEEFDLLKAVD